PEGSGPNPATRRPFDGGPPERAQFQDDVLDTLSLFTNLRCNQNCTFCNARSDEDDPAWANPGRVMAELRAGAGSGAKTLILTGGEPSLDPKLASYVRAARAS